MHCGDGGGLQDGAGSDAGEVKATTEAEETDGEATQEFEPI